MYTQVWKARSAAPARVVCFVCTKIVLGKSDSLLLLCLSVALQFACQIQSCFSVINLRRLGMLVLQRVSALSSFVTINFAQNVLRRPASWPRPCQ